MEYSRSKTQTPITSVETQWGRGLEAQLENYAETLISFLSLMSLFNKSAHERWVHSQCSVKIQFKSLQDRRPDQTSPPPRQ